MPRRQEIGRRWRGRRPWEQVALAFGGALVALAYAGVVSLVEFEDAGALPVPYVVALPVPNAGPVADPMDVAETASLFERVGFSLHGIRGGRVQVPPLFLSSLPPDLPEVTSPRERKMIFLKTVLPLVLRANAEVAADRARLRAVIEGNEDPADPDLTQWLASTASAYGVEDGDWTALLRRLDGVPPSLALAQAAIESGWGTSRFAQDGNALFGQWTWTGDGIVPREREAGRSHRVRRFDSLLESVRAYVHNLNTHPAYRGFRAARAEARGDGRVPKGRSLAAHLTRYSERGMAYVREVRAVIRANELTRLDATRLAPEIPGGARVQSAERR